MGDRRCLHCGTPIAREVTLKRKFCSLKCKRDWHNGQRAAAVVEAKRALDRTCKECGKPIQATKSALAKFCGVNCCARHNLRKRRAKG